MMLSPTSLLLTFFIDHLCKKGKVEQAMEIVKMLLLRGESPATLTLSSLLKGLFDLNRVEDAVVLFNNMRKILSNQGCLPNLIACNTMLDGLLKGGKPSMAKTLLLEMLDSGLSPDAYTYSILLDWTCNSRNWEEGRTFLENMVRDGIEPSMVTCKIMIKYLCSNGSILQAMKMVDLMIEKGLLDIAHDLLFEMELQGCLPNSVTFDVLIRGFAAQGYYTSVKRLLEKMLALNISPHSLSSSMIALMGSLGII